MTNLVFLLGTKAGTSARSQRPKDPPLEMAVMLADIGWRQVGFSNVSLSKGRTTALQSHAPCENRISQP